MLLRDLVCSWLKPTLYCHDDPETRRETLTKKLIILKNYRFQFDALRDLSQGSSLELNDLLLQILTPADDVIYKGCLAASSGGIKTLRYLHPRCPL